MLKSVVQTLESKNENEDRRRERENFNENLLDFTHGTYLHIAKVWKRNRFRWDSAQLIENE